MYFCFRQASRAEQLTCGMEQYAESPSFAGSSMRPRWPPARQHYPSGQQALGQLPANASSYSFAVGPDVKYSADSQQKSWHEACSWGRRGAAARVADSQRMDGSRHQPAGLRTAELQRGNILVTGPAKESGLNNLTIGKDTLLLTI